MLIVIKNHGRCWESVFCEMPCDNFEIVLQEWIFTSINMKNAKTLMIENAKQLISPIWTRKKQLVPILNPSRMQTQTKHSLLRFSRLILKYCFGSKFKGGKKSIPNTNPEPQVQHPKPMKNWNHNLLQMNQVLEFIVNIATPIIGRVTIQKSVT